MGSLGPGDDPTLDLDKCYPELQHVLGGPPARASFALVDLHPTLPLIPGVLALRRNFSPYDASYVALAEAFGCPLLTLDRRLAKAAQMHCAVEVVEW